MIRKAAAEDVGQIENAYEEHFQYEAEHTAFTVFKKGIYPTREDAWKAVDSGTMYVYEENGMIVGSMIMDQQPPVEYAQIEWRENLRKSEVMIIHLLMVRPCMSGRGIASALITYAAGLAKQRGCRALRLDTGSQNIPAVSLYKKTGFQIVANAPKQVGNAIAHKDHLYLEKRL